jgi:signal transduction histidine kinase
MEARFLKITFEKLRFRINPIKNWVYDKIRNLSSHLKDQVSKYNNSREYIAIKPSTPRIINSFRSFSKWAGIIGIVVGYHVLVGWIFDIGILRSPGSTYSPMKPNSALCSILAGISLLLIRRGIPSHLHQAIVKIFSSITIFIAIVTLIEHLFDLNLLIDRWIPRSAMGDLGESAPGRMALMTTLTFLMIGAAFILLDRPNCFHWAESLAIVCTVIALFAITGYMYRARSFYGQMPLYTSVVIFLISIGILFARSDRGCMAKISSDSFGGLMARRLLPATMIIPIVIGWVQYVGQKLGLYSLEPGFAFSAVANVLIFISIVWWSVNSLHRMDSKRRETELALQQTAAKLIRSNADLEQFAYVASHDLKEPLRAISGSIQIFHEHYKEQLDSSAEEIIKHTVDGATRMQTLIDDLLTYSRLTTREAALEPVNASEILREALVNLELAIRESRAVVSSDPLPTIKADHTQILQVLQNLISNAIKYRSDRTPKIHISAEDKKSEWLFSVSDNGIGIAPQYTDKIFRIFQRLHTRKEYSGTGIGLAICKKVIERHGGSIWVESEPEEGSTFFFTLPKHE